MDSRWVFITSPGGAQGCPCSLSEVFLLQLRERAALSGGFLLRHREGGGDFLFN